MNLRQDGFIVCSSCFITIAHRSTAFRRHVYGYEFEFSYFICFRLIRKKKITEQIKEKRNEKKEIELQNCKSA